MDLNEVKNFVNCDGERIILVENGKPTMVVMSYREYKKLSQNGHNETGENILNVSEEGSKVIKQVQPTEEDGLTLEDLPF